MVFALVYVEHGDVIEDFASHDEARAALDEFLTDHPEVADRVGILPFDDAGMPGEFEPGFAAGATNNPLLAICES
jgi:hypothetical protein